MTVRAWFTISALVLVALTAAVTVRLLAPLRAPEVVASAAGVRLEGSSRGSCWPQRSEELHCTRAGGSRPAPAEVPGRGRMRIVAAYPVQPEGGVLRIVADGTGEVVLREPFSARLDYDLEPGPYRLDVEARYQAGAYVRYAFRFRVPDRDV